MAKSDDDNDDRDTTETKSKNQRHRKDKPWDNDTIDHWKVLRSELFWLLLIFSSCSLTHLLSFFSQIEPVTQEEGLSAPLEESSFATLFPKYREKYIRETWPLVTRCLNKYGIACELNLTEGYLHACALPQSHQSMTANRDFYRSTY